MEFRESDEKTMGKRYGLDYFLPRLGVEANEQAVKTHLLKYIKKNPEYFKGRVEYKGRTVRLEDREEVLECLSEALEDSGINISRRNRKSYLAWSGFAGQFLRGMSLEDKTDVKKILIKKSRKKGPLAKAVKIREREMDIFLQYLPRVLEVLRKEGYNPSQDIDNTLRIGADRYRKQSEAEQEALAEER